MRLLRIGFYYTTKRTGFILKNVDVYNIFIGQSQTYVRLVKHYDAAQMTMKSLQMIVKWEYIIHKFVAGKGFEIKDYRYSSEYTKTVIFPLLGME